MKKMNFKWLVVLCITIGFVNVAKAQIYSSEDCFYSSAGSSSVSYVVKFEGNRVWLKSVSHSTVRSNLAKSKDFYENQVWTDGKDGVQMYEYDYYKSTSSREVYKRVDKKAIFSYDCWWQNGGDRGVGNCRASFGSFPSQGCGKHGYTELGTVYVAFSKDKSSIIKWYEKKDNYDGNIKTTDYTRVPKADLLPKAVNYDFLND